MGRVLLLCSVRLMTLAAQRFIAGTLHDAMQVYARRQKQAPARLKDAGYDIKDKRPVLLTEDLAEALAEVRLKHIVDPFAYLLIFTRDCICPLHGVTYSMEIIQLFLSSTACKGTATYAQAVATCWTFGMPATCCANQASAHVTLWLAAVWIELEAAPLFGGCPQQRAARQQMKGARASTKIGTAFCESVM